VKNIINQLVEMVKEAKEDAEEGVRDCQEHNLGIDEYIYEGWVEALDFVQTSIDGLLLDKPERRKSNRRVLTPKRLSLPFEGRRNVIVLGRRSDDPLKVDEEDE
jgi:hypothetical protein